MGERFVADAEPQAIIANMAWACAEELDHSCPKFLAAIEIHAKEFVSKGGSTIHCEKRHWPVRNWATSPYLRRLCESQSKSFVEQATPQGIANTATAGAELGHLCPDLFAAIKSESKRLPREIADLARACGKLGHEIVA
jgi:hypothetical protein